MSNTALGIARACLRAYVDKDRAAIEALLDDDFHFTSPIDNALDRATYLQVCWPNSAAMVRFNHIYEVEDGDRAFIVYEALTSTGKRFRNSEVYIVRDGKLLATEVYFGWDLPHRVPQGAHVENEGQRRRWSRRGRESEHRQEDNPRGRCQLPAFAGVVAVGPALGLGCEARTRGAPAPR